MGATEHTRVSQKMKMYNVTHMILLSIHFILREEETSPIIEMGDSCFCFYFLFKK